MRTDVVGVHLLIEVRLLQLGMHLGCHTGENDVNALLMVHLDEMSQVVNARTLTSKGVRMYIDVQGDSEQHTSLVSMCLKKHPQSSLPKALSILTASGKIPCH